MAVLLDCSNKCLNSKDIQHSDWPPPVTHLQAGQRKKGTERRAVEQVAEELILFCVDPAKWQVFLLVSL